MKFLCMREKAYFKRTEYFNKNKTDFTNRKLQNTDNTLGLVIKPQLGHQIDRKKKPELTTRAQKNKLNHLLYREDPKFHTIA